MDEAQKANSAGEFASALSVEGLDLGRRLALGQVCRQLLRCKLVSVGQCVAAFDGPLLFPNGEDHAAL